MTGEKVSAFLEHYGTKGMRWGVRKASKGASIAGRATGRAAKRTASAAKKNPATTAKVLAGSMFLARVGIGIVGMRGRSPGPSIFPPPMSSAQWAKTAASGESRIANEGLGVLRVKAIDVVGRSVPEVIR